MRFLFLVFTVIQNIAALSLFEIVQALLSGIDIAFNLLWSVSFYFEIDQFFPRSLIFVMKPL